jgi:acetylornithine/N-succinyldiaminopimelate aminotransferase
VSSPHAGAMGLLDGAAPERCPFMPSYGAPTVRLVSGEGSWVVDTHGRRYLDLLCGLAVTGLGHAHPEVADAVAAQARTLVHVSNLFASTPGAELAVRIDRLLGGGGQVFLCNSGAEANEAAIKLARRWGGPGRHTIIATWGSFHGRTLGALAATGQTSKQEPFQPLPEGFRHAVYGDITDLERQLDDSVAAVMVEPVQGEGGVIPAPPGYLESLRSLCDERGVLLMVDEVQTGLGRTGRWFGFEHAGIRPDVVMLAKALGNGMPIGACWASADVAGSFTPGDHGTTYGGQPLAAAAALATLGVLERDDAPGRAAATGERLASALSALDGVADVRGRGLLLAAELAEGLDARQVVADLLAAGVIANAVTSTAVRFAPPLFISDDDLDHGVAALASVLTAHLTASGASDHRSADVPTAGTATRRTHPQEES